MKKLFSIFLCGVVTLLCSLSVWADIIIPPEETAEISGQAAEQATVSPHVIWLAAGVVVVCVGILIAVVRNKKP